MQRREHADYAIEIGLQVVVTPYLVVNLIVPQ